jgi:hypothetical protein
VVGPVQHLARPTAKWRSATLHLESGEHAVGAQVGHMSGQVGEQAHNDLVARLLGDLLGGGGDGHLQGGMKGG